MSHEQRENIEKRTPNIEVPRRGDSEGEQTDSFSHRSCPATISEYRSLYSFGTITNDGASPVAGLISSGNTLYGTTEFGGSNGDGTVFGISIGSANDFLLYSFGSVPDDGTNPVAALVLSGSTLYGTASQGGNNNVGTIFSIGVNGNGYTTLQSFGSYDSDFGASPQADFKLLGDLLYGTASEGGAFGDGMVFRVSINGNGFSDIYDFTNVPDGANPKGGVCSP